MNKSIYRFLERSSFGKIPRREFIQAVTALGVTTMAAESLFASFQQEPSDIDAAGQTPRPTVVEGPAGAVLLEQLKAMGLKYIFHTNTSGLVTITDAVDTREVQVIMIPHEGLAVSATEGYALAGGPMPFFMGNKVGVGHTMSNLYNAWKDRTPMLVTFAGSTLNGRAGQDGFQEWDEHLEPTDPFVAWHWGCTSAGSIPEVLRRGVRFSHTPPGAPVTLDFPTDLLRENIRVPIYAIDPQRIRPVFRPGPDLVDEAARLLIEAQHPVLVVGPEISRGNANRALIALAEKLGAPVCQTDDLFCDFPNRHPLYLGAFNPRMRFPSPIDLVVDLGAKIGSVGDRRLVHVSTDSDSIGRTSEVTVPVLADVSTFIDELSAAVDGILTADRLGRIRTARTAETTAYARQLREAREVALRGGFDQRPMTWDRVGYELDQALDHDAVIVPELGPDSGNKILEQLDQGIDSKLRIGRTVGYALGWGLGAAFGVQLALPDRQVVSLQGDGGVLFGQTEMLWTISRYDAPILIVVMNNYSYNETRSRNLSSGGRQFQTGRELVSYLGDPNVDFSKIAAAYSIQGEKVQDPGELPQALQRALNVMKDGRPYVLDVEVAPDAVSGDSTWHPNFSISQLGNRRDRSSWME